MKSGLVLLCSWLVLGCSAAAPGEKSDGQAGSGGRADAAGGGVSSAGSQTAGLGGGAVAVAGSASGGASVAGAGAGQGGSAGAVNSGGSAGVGGAAGAGSCVAEPQGALLALGDTVHDAKTCLDWMKATQTGVNYAAAETFCADSTLGGFDDWRIPSASELASTVTKCGKYPPEGPIDTTVFDLQGDGYWTTTSAGESNKVCAIGMLNAGGYYHYGTAGPQVVRCVRGSGTAPMVTDCVTAQGCMNW